MAVRITWFGKAKRLRSKRQLAHRPSGFGHGKWHSRTTLWAYKRKARRKRLIAADSRRQNRGRA
jgi:hypothetical protein